MGLFDAITGTVVMRYKADTEQAKASVRALSGEQKKAAQEQVAALEAQGKASEEMFAKYAKGAAVIAGSYALARTGLEAFKTESRLSAGSAGVDLDRLSKAYDGLRTRTELMTLAQAGSQGAWKLTTGQIELVIGGMRALEAKGYDTKEVFERFTDVLKKGKTEGLDDFGISIQDTGNKTDDLRQLMRALGQEVASVGGNFTKLDDEATRAIVHMEDGLTRLRKLVGEFVNELLGASASIGRNAGFLVSGPNNADQDNSTLYNDASYARGFASLRLTGGRRVDMSRDSTFAERAGLTDVVSAEDLKRSAQLSALRSNLGSFRDVTKLDAALSSLPQGWEKVAPEVADRVKRQRDQLVGSLLLDAMDSLFDLKINAKAGARPARRRARAANDNGEDFYSSIAGRALDIAGRAAEQAQAREAEQAQAREAEQAAAEEGRQASARTRAAADAASMLATLADAKAAAAELQSSLAEAMAERQGYLASLFGELWEIDEYTEALTTLGRTAHAVTGEIFSAFASGEEISIKAIRRVMSAEIAAEGQRLWARGLSGVLTGGLNLAYGNPTGAAQIKAGLAAMAGGVAIGGIARAMAPGASGPTQTGRGASGGPAVAAAPVRNTNVVVIGDAFSEQSSRQRARNVERALRNSSVYYPTPQGAAP